MTRSTLAHALTVYLAGFILVASTSASMSFSLEVMEATPGDGIYVHISSTPLEGTPILITLKIKNLNPSNPVISKNYNFSTQEQQDLKLAQGRLAMRVPLVAGWPTEELVREVTLELSVTTKDSQSARQELVLPETRQLVITAPLFELTGHGVAHPGDSRSTNEPIFNGCTLDLDFQRDPRFSAQGVFVPPRKWNLSKMQMGFFVLPEVHRNNRDQPGIRLSSTVWGVWGRSIFDFYRPDHVEECTHSVKNGGHHCSKTDLRLPEDKFPENKRTPVLVMLRYHTGNFPDDNAWFHPTSGALETVYAGRDACPKRCLSGTQNPYTCECVCRADMVEENENCVCRDREQANRKNAEGSFCSTADTSTCACMCTHPLISVNDQCVCAKIAPNENFGMLHWMETPNKVEDSVTPHTLLKSASHPLLKKAQRALNVKEKTKKATGALSPRQDFSSNDLETALMNEISSPKPDVLLQTLARRKTWSQKREKTWSQIEKKRGVWDGQECLSHHAKQVMGAAHWRGFVMGEWPGQYFPTFPNWDVSSEGQVEGLHSFYVRTSPKGKIKFRNPCTHDTTNASRDVRFDVFLYNAIDKLDLTVILSKDLVHVGSCNGLEFSLSAHTRVVETLGKYEEYFLPPIQSTSVIEYDPPDTGYRVNTKGVTKVVTHPPSELQSFWRYTDGTKKAFKWLKMVGQFGAKKRNGKTVEMMAVYEFQDYSREERPDEGSWARIMPDYPDLDLATSGKLHGEHNFARKDDGWICVKGGVMIEAYGLGRILPYGRYRWGGAQNGVALVCACPANMELKPDRTCGCKRWCKYGYYSDTSGDTCACAPLDSRRRSCSPDGAANFAVTNDVCSCLAKRTCPANQEWSDNKCGCVCKNGETGSNCGCPDATPYFNGIQCAQALPPPGSGLACRFDYAYVSAEWISDFPRPPCGEKTINAWKTEELYIPLIPLGEDNGGFHINCRMLQEKSVETSGPLEIYYTNANYYGLHSPRKMGECQVGGRTPGERTYVFVVSDEIAFEHQGTEDNVSTIKVNGYTYKPNPTTLTQIQIPP